MCVCVCVCAGAEGMIRLGSGFGSEKLRILPRKLGHRLYWMYKMRRWRCRLQKLEGKTFLSPPKWNEYIPKKIDTQKVYVTYLGLMMKCRLNIPGIREVLSTKR